jgi:hypothetical protein
MTVHGFRVESKLEAAMNLRHFTAIAVSQTDIAVQAADFVRVSYGLFIRLFEPHDSSIISQPNVLKHVLF